MAALEKLRSAATFKNTRNSVSSTSSPEVHRPPSKITDHNPNRIIISLTLSGPSRLLAKGGEVPMADNHVRVFDTTLRDGEQAPGFSLRPAEKLLLARQIDAL